MISHEIPQKCYHVQPLLCNLHWLSIHPGIDCKISTLCFNTLTSSSPVYIAQLLSVYTPSRHLRSSSDTRTLCIPVIKIVLWSNSILLDRPNSMELTALRSPTLRIFSCFYLFIYFIYLINKLIYF